MIWNALEKYRDAGLLVARLGLGIGFFYYHGYGKLTGGPERWTGLGGNMELLGISFWPAFWGFMIAMAETLVATMIAVGFLFRPACLILAFGMFVAWLSHVTSGQGNPGNAFKNFFFLVGLILIGPGKYSVDAWLEKRGRNAER
ncbi:MAG TPA: DoxX family protein [Rhodothermales bacterium]|nr:DoxX family protein [Rhodothermales bacterium]